MEIFQPACEPNFLGFKNTINLQEFKNQETNYLAQLVVALIHECYAKRLAKSALYNLYSSNLCCQKPTRRRLGPQAKTSTALLPSFKSPIFRCSDTF